MLRLTLFMGVFVSVAMGLAAAGTAPLPPFRELRELILTNAIGITGEQLDQAAGAAILALVHGRVLESGEMPNEESNAPAIAGKRIHDPGCAYVRAGQISLGFAPQLAAILAEPSFATNTFGLILDLRFAGGTEYAGAANAADLFATEAGPLLDWGTGRAESTAKTNAWSRPVVVLVNRETRGAAEALAGALRVQHSALVIGNRTSGTAAIHRDLPLPDGRRLRIAAAGVKTGDGLPLPSTGLVPDIQVTVPADAERAYLADPFAPIPATTNIAGGTNRLASTTKTQRRITEADLVRARKAGEPEPDSDGPSATPAATSQPVATVRDPVLARGIDLLKGLRVLQSAPKP